MFLRYGYLHKTNLRIIAEETKGGEGTSFRQSYAAYLNCCKKMSDMQLMGCYTSFMLRPDMLDSSWNLAFFGAMGKEIEEREAAEPGWVKKEISKWEASSSKKKTEDLEEGEEVEEADDDDGTNEPVS